MNGLTEHGQRQEAWQRVIACLNALHTAAHGLQKNRSAMLTTLDNALGGISERAQALRPLGCLDLQDTIALMDKLVSLSLSHGDALAVRRVLGGLAHDEAARTVPLAVWKQLDITDDDDAYRRLAELLRHLGLSEALRQLCERALKSNDPAVQEVGRDFRS
jgi:hypothetical protein